MKREKIKQFNLEVKDRERGKEGGGKREREREREREKFKTSGMPALCAGSR